MDDKDFYQVRKNLNIISVVILILAFTNAEVDSLSVIGIDLKLNGHKLYAALFILYLYFIWRFLTKLPLKSGFWNDFLDYYMENVDGAIKQHNFIRYRTLIIARSEKLAQELKNPETQFLKQILVRFAPNPITKLRLVATFILTKQLSNGSNNLDGTHDFEVSKMFVLRKIVRFCIKYDKFGDYLFPVIPVTVNFCFFIFMSEWQGSFYSFFLK